MSAESQVLPTRTCPECAEPFTAIPRKDRTLPEACKRCVRKFNGRKRRGILPAAFRENVDARKLEARKRHAQQLRQQFGDISEREAEIFSFGVGVGYTRGYNVASRPKGKPS